MNRTTDARLKRFLQIGIGGGAGEQSDAVKARMFGGKSDDTPAEEEDAIVEEPGGLASAAAEVAEEPEKKPAAEKAPIAKDAKPPEEEPEEDKPNDLEALREQQKKVGELEAAAAKPAAKANEVPEVDDDLEGYHPEALQAYQAFANDKKNSEYIAKLVQLNESEDPAVRAHGQIYAAALMLNAQKDAMRDEFSSHAVGTINEQRETQDLIGGAIGELERGFPHLAAEMKSNKYAMHMVDNVSVDLAQELGYIDAKDFLLKNRGKSQNISTYVNEVGKRTMKALRLEAVKPGAAANGGASNGDGSKARQKMPARAATAERGSPRAAGAGGQSTDRKDQARAIKDRLLG